MPAWRVEVGDLRRRGLPRLRAGARNVGGDRPADGVLAGRLQGAGEPDRVGVVAVDGVHAHLAGGDGAGLVEHDGVDAPGRLEDGGVADHDAELRGPAGADEQRRRGGEPERAGAGDDQHGHGRGEAALGVAQQGPQGEGEHGDAEHHRDEHRGDLVGEPLHGCLRGLRVRDQGGDPGQGGVRADAGDLDDQAAAGAHGGADDLVALALVDREALPGHHRLVDRGATLYDDPVGGDLLAGAHHEAHPRPEQVHVDQALGAVLVEDGGLLGAHPEQRPERGAGPVLGPGLAPPAEQQERGDGGGDLDVAVHAAGERLEGRPAVGHQGAEGDQGVHGAGAVPGVEEGGPVERPAAVRHDGGGQDQPGPHHPGVVGHAGGHHQHEHDDGQRDARRAGDGGSRPRPPAPLPPRRRESAGSGGGGDRGGVAGRLHRRHQRVARHESGVEVDRRGRCGEVHGGAHAVQPVELLLDPADARGAGHPADQEVDVLFLLAGRGVAHASA